MSKLKWSRFNYLFNREKQYYLYNSLSNSFAKLDKESYDVLNNGNYEQIDTGLFEQLVQIKAFVNNDQDEINKVKFITISNRNDDTNLILTINPTFACNFACSYCFEKKHHNIFMSDEIENGIISFINKHPNAKNLDITWFGGEPLLAFDRIISLTKKMQALGLRYKAGIITNGYLLTEKVIGELPKLGIGSIQITIDGMEALHNSRRCLKSGGPTFETIVKNIDILKTQHPEIYVSVRVNIDYTNDDDFLDLYHYFTEKKYNNFSISLSFVTDLSGCHPCSTMYNREQKARFITKLRKKYKLDFSWIYPQNDRYECAIRNRNAVVIGPEGELYKCWNDVGIKEKVIGNIEGKVTNENLLLRYLVAADPLEDTKCQECLLFPVCGGGCPYSRIQNLYDEQKTNVCPLIKDHLEEFLLTHATCKPHNI